jgi:hypothetical protein
MKKRFRISRGESYTFAQKHAVSGWALAILLFSNQGVFIFNIHTFIPAAKIIYHRRF